MDKSYIFAIFSSKFSLFLSFSRSPPHTHTPFCFRFFSLNRFLHLYLFLAISFSLSPTSVYRIFFSFLSFLRSLLFSLFHFHSIFLFISLSYSSSFSLCYFSFSISFSFFKHIFLPPSIISYLFSLYIISSSVSLFYFSLFFVAVYISIIFFLLALLHRLSFSFLLSLGLFNARPSFNVLSNFLSHTCMYALYPLSRAILIGHEIARQHALELGAGGGK